VLHAPKLHFELLHTPVALAYVHAAPHAPQLSGSVFKYDSHPLFGLPSQFPKPFVHVGTHTPEVHAVVPFGLVHCVLHDPHAVTVFSCASHPLLTRPSQLPQPALQLRTAQAPVVHVPVAFAGEHAVPQLPQFVMLVSEVSQPLTGLLSQFPQPDKHVGTQAPELQSVVPCELVHVMPQPPQLVTDVFLFVSHPLFLLPSQSAHPALQIGVQTPLTHEVEPFGFVHSVPQAPQLLTLVCRFVSQPLTTLPSQLPKPALHAGTHTPDGHVVVPFAFVHTVPHAPQLLVLYSEVSQPLVRASPSQLPHPAEHAMAQLPRLQEAVP
jgi:hypothetical protein